MPFTKREVLGLAAPSNRAQAVTPHLPVTTGCYGEVSRVRLPSSSYFFRKKYPKPAEENKGMLDVLLLPSQCHRAPQGTLPCKVCFPRPSVGWWLKEKPGHEELFPSAAVISVQVRWPLMHYIQDCSKLLPV